MPILSIDDVGLDDVGVANDVAIVDDDVIAAGDIIPSNTISKIEKRKYGGDTS